MSTKEDFLDGYLSEAVAVYCKNDTEFTQLTARNRDIKGKNPKIEDIVDNARPHALTEEECAELVAVLKNENSRIFSEYRACYMKGLLDGIEGKSKFTVSE